MYSSSASAISIDIVVYNGNMVDQLGGRMLPTAARESGVRYAASGHDRSDSPAAAL